MPNNYILLEKIVVPAAGAASVTFANIPQTGYTDLVVKMSARAVDSANNWYLTKIQFNTDTTSGNYSARIVGGFGSSAFSSTSSNYAGYVPSAARTANTFGNNEIYIPNYTGSTQKSYSTDTVTEGNGSSFEILGLWAGLWTGTAAINQIVLSLDSGNLAANSTFYLYGVAKLGTTPTIAPKATGGDIVMTDGTYWYHAFRSSGTFTPAVAFNADVLVVAGGGGSGAFGGGGGAGGVASYSSQSLAVSNYTCTIGGGGTGGVYLTSAGTNGANSSFGALSAAIGGGFGGNANAQRTPGNGGSGGGAGSADPVAATISGGTATAGQGNIGGNAPAVTSSLGAGGGGGAGSAGTSGTTSGTAAPAGEGTTSFSSWGSATGTGQNVSGTFYYAGGGFGYSSASGRGGYGGGGAGGSGGAGTAGTANTGGGGGGGSGTGTNGGSGIVIVRYLVA